MAAGYEIAQETSLGSNVAGQHIGNMISKVLAAKVMADKEREYAQKQAFDQGIDKAEFDQMFPRGEFFRKALIGEFGGFKLQKKKQELSSLYRKALLVGKVSKNPALRKRIFKSLKETQIYAKANLKNAKQFRSQFDYTNYEEYFAEGTEERVPNTRRKFKNAIDNRSKRVSREQIIESIDNIAKSIERTAQSITQSSASVYGTLIVANQLQADVAQDLKVRNTTLEDKLQTLVDVISKQTQVQKDYIDKKEDQQHESQLEKTKVAAAAITPDDLMTKKDESAVKSFVESEEIDGNIGASTAQNVEMQQMQAYGYDEPPKAETGGIFSGKQYPVELHGTEAAISDKGKATLYHGPDSGYVQNLKGNQTIIPLNNNYTQGEKSAVDGKVRPKPKDSIVNDFKLPKFEMGSDPKKNNYSTALNINTDQTQPLVDAASNFMMATGGGVLAATTAFMNSISPYGDGIQPEVSKVGRSIANVFDLPSTIVNRASKTQTGQKITTEGKEKKEDKGDKKSLFEKMTEGFAKLLEGLGNGINPNPGNNDLTHNAPVADVSQDFEFLQEVHKLAGETGTKPSELLAMYNAESRLDPKAVNPKSGATGLFQLMFGGQFGDVRYGLTQEQFRNLSRADQVRIHRRYLEDTGFFEKGYKGIANVKTANIGPAYLGEDPNTPMYRSGTQAYADNAPVDTVYGNNDGIITAADYAAFVLKTGQETQFRKYNDSSYATGRPQNPPSTPPPSGRLGQKIRENFGMKPHDRFNFTHNNKLYNAYKTNVGFDFYEGSRLITSPQEEQAVIESFRKAKSGQFSPPTTDQPSSIPNSFLQSSTQSPGPQVAVLNIGASQNRSSAGFALPPTEKDIVPRRSDPLKEIYISPIL